MVHSANEVPKIPTIQEELRDLDDGELLAGLKLAMQGERNMTIKVLHHLNEIERRQLYLELGYHSLFDYCTRKLKYSSSAAWRRIQSARCIKRYPEMLVMLHSREINLSTIALIAPVLSDRNKALLLRQVRGKSHRAVERLVAEYRPARAYRDRVRPVRVPASPPRDVDAELFRRELERRMPGVGGWSAAGAGSRRATDRKLLVQFLASEALMEQFEEAKALLSHRLGEETFEAVLGLVLADFLDRHSPKARQRRREERKAKRAAAEKPKDRTPKKPNEGSAKKPERSRPREPRRAENHCRRRQWKKPSRHIPAEVRDQIFTRDGRRCTYVAPDGTRCGSRKSLQIDHIRPFATGGTHDPSNLRLLCAKHNQLVAEKILGKQVMSPFRRRE